MGAEYMTSPEKEVERLPQVRRELNLLDDEVESLKEHIKILEEILDPVLNQEERLDPVLNQIDEKSEASTDKEEPLVKLAEDIRTKRQKINNMDIIIRYILNQIEL